MSKDLLINIAKKQFTEANEMFSSIIMEKVQEKLNEKKKMVAAYSLGTSISEGKIRKMINKIGQTGRIIAAAERLKKKPSDRPGREAEIDSRQLKTVTDVIPKKNPKGLAEGNKSPKEAVQSILNKHFQKKKFMSDKDALEKSSNEREKDPEFQKWKEKRSKK